MIEQTEFQGFPREVERPPETPFERMSRLVREGGALVPQALLPSVLGLSNQRVSQLLANGRFHVEKIEGMAFVSESEIERFLAAPKTKGGRGNKRIPVPVSVAA